MLVPVLIVLVMAGIITFGILSHSAATDRRTSTLASIGNWLGYPHEVVGNAVSGKRDGTHVKLAYETRGSGSTSESWTEVSVDIPASYPLTLYVRRHALFDRGKIESGRMIDVLVGDKAFDDAYLVEAAPSDVVRELIDHRARAYLMGASAMELVTERSGDTAVLKLSIRRWEEDFPAAQALVDEAMRLARRVREVYAKVESATPVETTGGPFRAEHHAATSDAAARREYEVERVKVLQPRRAQADLDVGMVILGVTVVGAVAIGVMWIVHAL